MKVAKFALRVAGFCVLAAGVGFGQLGQLGSTVEDAKTTDLFTFFHLKETGRDAAVVVHYRPSGPDFHDLAEVDLVLKGNRITGARLSLARSFVAGKNGVFAQDLMRSFLRTAMSARDLQTLMPVIAQAGIPGLAGPSDGFACTTPEGFSATQDASLTVQCDAATDLLTFQVTRKEGGS